MIALVLLVVLALVVGGCVCVVWAERGGPRWVRAVATMTRTASGMARRAERNRRRGLTGDSGDGG
ncbi:hypothetical protein [Streptomyces uncialis]|uniref:hypothetical protein n=1 Tax=Streptomyces uncialis TaxID=1048205 RepID=UPI0022538D54|nr:hypothetical protein [Streptomyces uncialis]MCX4661658.1 hypothetical protein [Streptomyces uncialis]WTE08932.1 hypothetical protein OG924_00695 [Streptomyces uncialis]